MSSPCIRLTAAYRCADDIVSANELDFKVASFSLIVLVSGMYKYVEKHDAHLQTTGG